MRRVRTRADPEKPLGVDLVFQVPHASVERALEPPGLARPQRPQVEHPCDCRDDAGDVGGVQVVRGEHPRKRRARRHTPGDHLTVGGKFQVLATIGAGGVGVAGMATCEGHSDAEREREAGQRHRHAEEASAYVPPIGRVNG